MKIFNGHQPIEKPESITPPTKGPAYKPGNTKSNGDLSTLIAVKALSNRVKVLEEKVAAFESFAVWDRKEKIWRPK